MARNDERSAGSHLFSLAVRHHQAGQLAQAEQLYRNVLAAEPTHLGALQYFRVLALQSNRPALGIDAIGSALALNEPTRSHYQAGYALYQLRRVDDAVAHYRRRSRWRRCRPADQGMTNLAFWHLFETENPDTFAGVYKFWVQKKAD